MTVQVAIQKADELRPNTFAEEMKFMWLSELDGRIKTELFDAHEGFEDREIPTYIPGNRTNELFAPEPYTDMYLYWLFMKMDFMNGEIDRFNNDAMMHNTSWLAFSNYINRNFPPRKKAEIAHV